MCIDNAHEIGDIVYLKTDQDQLPRIVVAIEVYKQGELLYSLMQGTIRSPHYDFEITTEKIHACL